MDVHSYRDALKKEGATGVAFSCKTIKFNRHGQVSKDLATSNNLKNLTKLLYSISIISSYCYFAFLRFRRRKEPW